MLCFAFSVYQQVSCRSGMRFFLAKFIKEFVIYLLWFLNLKNLVFYIIPFYNNANYFKQNIIRLLHWNNTVFEHTLFMITLFYSWNLLNSSNNSDLTKAKRNKKKSVGNISKCCPKCTKLSKLKARVLES